MFILEKAKITKMVLRYSNTQLMKGARLAKSMLTSIKKDIFLNQEMGLRNPNLTAIQVGNNRSSDVYLRKKSEACQYCGIDFDQINLQENVTQKYLHDTIDYLNQDKSVDGIIVQLPLPQGLNQYEACTKVHWSKDVDGFHPYNFGKLALGFNTFMPATVAGIITLIDSELGISWLRGKNICIVGRSDHICKPLQLWMQNSMMRQQPGGNATVTLVHEETETNFMFNVLKNADLVVTATGRNQMWLTGDHIKDGSVIIDVAFNRDAKTNKTFGDVNIESCLGIASKITPVPNGIGPLTVSELMKNVLRAFDQRQDASLRKELEENFYLDGYLVDRAKSDNDGLVGSEKY